MQLLSETAKGMAECSASECSCQGKEQDVKRARGRPRKRPVKEVEPFEEEVLIEGAAASLSSCNQLNKLEKPVCSLQIPNNLLFKWHKERAGEPYTACLNKTVCQQALQVRSSSRRVEDKLAKCAGSLHSKYSATSGENRSKIRRGHYTIAICAGELESCGDLMNDIESLEMQEQEVAVLQQAIEHLVQEREAENWEVIANNGKPINEVSDLGLEVESITARTSRWRWGQVLAHLKLHSLQFLFPGTAKNVLSGYGKYFTLDTVHVTVCPGSSLGFNLCDHTLCD